MDDEDFEAWLSELDDGAATDMNNTTELNEWRVLGSVVILLALTGYWVATGWFLWNWLT